MGIRYKVKGIKLLNAEFQTFHRVSGNFKIPYTLYLLLFTHFQIIVLHDVVNIREIIHRLYTCCN
jgi:hypothetical protein